MRGCMGDSESVGAGEGAAAYEGSGAGDADRARAAADGHSERSDDRITRMGTDSVPRLIIEFAIPSIIGMLVNGAYNVIDSVFLGQAMGSIGLSATTVAQPIMIVFLSLCMLIGNGGNALAALRLGEGRHVDAERSLGNTMFLAIVLWAIIAVGVSIPPVMDAILDISSATDEVRGYAADFIRILGFGVLFQIVGMGLNNFIRTAGAPNRALLTMILGAVVCIVFNYLFVMRFGWGVHGSALATVMGQAASCASVLWFFTISKNSPLKLRLWAVKPDGSIIPSILTLGVPSSLVQVGMAVVSFIVNMLLVVYGAQSAIGQTAALASIGVVQRIAMFTVLPLIGVAIAIQPLLGFNYGARLFGRVRATLGYGILGATTIALLMWVSVHVWPVQIVSAFGISDESLREFTIFALKVQLLMLPVVGFQIIGANYFQATGQPVRSIVLSMSRQILFLIPLLFLLPSWLPIAFPQLTGLDAVYFAAPMADALSIVLTGVLICIELRKLKGKEMKLRPIP